MSRSACHSKAGMHVRWWDKWRLSSKQRRVAALEQRMLHMERLLEQRHAAHIDIHVDTIHVDSASLERLMFRLGHLDIEELSGSLNLGNNFGSRVVQSDAASTDEQGGRAEKSPQPSQPRQGGGQPHPAVHQERGSREKARPGEIRSTQTGYTFSLPKRGSDCAPTAKSVPVNGRQPDGWSAQSDRSETNRSER